MKNIIKNYQTPKVDNSILSTVLNKENKKVDYTNIFSYLLITLFFWLFIKNSIILNFSYIDISLSMLQSVNIYLLIILNLIISIIYFISQNILLIISVVSIYFIGNIYSYKIQKEN